MRKRFVLVILLFLISVVGCGKGKEVNYSKLKDDEFLTTIKEWEKEGSPKNVWTFEADGKGSVTVNGKDIYPYTWTLDGNELSTVTKWLYDITDIFEISFDKEAVSYTVVDQETGNVSTYLPKGSQQYEEMKENKPTSLIGVWTGKNGGTEYGWAFVETDSGFGMFVDDKMYVMDRYLWNQTAEDEITIENESGARQCFKYELVDNNLRLYTDSKLEYDLTKKQTAYTVTIVE